MSTQRPTAAPQQPTTVSGDHLQEKKEEEEEHKTTSTAQQLTTISRRPSPNKVQPLTIYCQQAHTALLKKREERPKKLGKPQVKPTYHLKKKNQSAHQQVPVPNESNQPG